MTIATAWLVVILAEVFYLARICLLCDNRGCIMKELDAMEKNIIETYAKKSIERIDYDGKMVDIVEIAQKYGFKILTTKMADNTDGFIVVNPDANKIFNISGTKFIGFNFEKTLEQKRFIIAHELGHYLLHYMAANRDGEMFAKRENIKGKNDDEQDVDYFAACVLMPEEAFLKEYHALKKQKKNEEQIIEKLAELFVVEKESVKRRIGEVQGKDQLTKKDN